MQFHITINAQIGGTEYNFCDTQEVDTEEWDIDGVAGDAIDVLAFKMKSALNPCFWDHAMHEYRPPASASETEVTK